MLEENIKPSTSWDNSLGPGLNYLAKIRVKYDASCLKQDKITFNHETIVNIYIVYEINLWPYNQDNTTVFKDSLFDAVELTKNV